MNVDAFDASVADLLCRLTCLPFADGTFSLVECHHTIEHLGPIHAIYALSECFRVMKPRGRLVIETPDIEASFGSFLEDRSAGSRASLLTWIFGLDSPGMGHRMLYPARLLGKMLREAGFDRVRIREPRTHLYREGLRVTAVRSARTEAEVLARWRQKALAGGVIDADNHLEALELERVFVGNLRRYHSNPAAGKNRILDNVVCSPLGVLLWCEAMREAGCSIAELETIANLARALARLDLPRRLVRDLQATIESPAGPGDAYDRVFSRARAAVGRLACRPEREVASSVRGAFPARGGPAVRAFTRHLVLTQVRRMRDRGTKCMALGRHAQAARLLRLAVNSGIESYYATVNLAMLDAMFSRLGEAVELYRTALTCRAGEGVDAVAREELVKCLLHLRRREEAYEEAERFCTARLGNLWKAIILYHGGDPAGCHAKLARLARTGFRHEHLERYLEASRGDGGESSVPLPPLRTEPLVTGEGVHHLF